MNRGEIWTVAGGVDASTPRPAVIIRDDRFEALNSVTVIPMTSIDVSAPILRVPVSATETTGLVRPSFMMIDKLTTVRRSNVLDRLGRLTAEQMVEVERSLLVFLGLAD